MTPATISSRLVQKPSSSTLYVPPSRNDWDLLFQPMFDELLNPPPSVDHQAPKVIALIVDVIPPVQDESTSSHSLTIVDQDAPSPSKSQTPPETQGISHEVSVSAEGVKELKRNVKIKGVKEEAILTHSILTDLQVSPTKPGRMTKPYSSHRFIANCFNVRNLKMEVKLKYMFQDFRYFDTVHPSRSDEVLKLKNFKKDESKSSQALSLPEHTLNCMTLKLADRSVSNTIDIAKDVSFKDGVFHFPADFVVVDFEPDPRVPLVLRRCFLKTTRALIDVHKDELTLRIKNEAITYNLDQTVRYSANYNQITANKIDVICDEYSQEVLGFSDTTVSGNPTPHDDPIVSTTSHTLTLFGDSDFLLFEEADAFLGLEDDPDSPNINPFYYDLEGDILLLETILNNKPLPPLPNHEQYFPSYKKELKVCEAKTVKSSVDEPHEVELKDLPHHLEYAFLEGDNKFPVIIAKELGDEEKSAHIKKEVEKLLDAGLIYPIFDSPWVSPIHCVPKKGSFPVVGNEENELIPTRLVTEWWVCIDYRKLNEATRKDHFPLLFMDQMLERLAGNEYYCFLDDFFGEKSHFMVKEGILLGHKNYKNGIEVDRAKVDVIAKLPHPTTVK
nr:reverse transcriptase domain-containing protein [Tanacetum cinerariifolium]